MPPTTGTVKPIIEYSIVMKKKLNKSTFKFTTLIFLFKNRNTINIRNKKFSKEANLSNNEPSKNLKGLKKTFEIAIKIDFEKPINDFSIFGS